MPRTAAAVTTATTTTTTARTTTATKTGTRHEPNSANFFDFLITEFFVVRLNVGTI